ncbi:MAG TPA: S41 family peptidase [Gemmatimonadaceae bacterium]|nr:S41 family peptidase [Gemmatimonadaceae bacterium]
MLRHRKVAVAAIAIVPLLAGGFVLQDRASRDGARLFDQVLSIVNARFVDTVDAGGLYEKAAKGLVHELNDPYTVLFTPKELASFSTQTNGRYGGVGMQIEDVKGNITVSRVFPHTPAEDAGIREGDRIVQVDTAVVKGWKLEQVSDRLKGTPGSRIDVKFARPGVADPVAVRFTRAIIHIPAVPYAIMLDGKVGYIPFQQFNETASDEVVAAIRKLTKEGAKGVVLDMRDNPGGILDQAIETSNLFLKEGQDIVSVRGRGTDPQVVTARETPLVPNLPLVVLVDDGSASAAEIVAGALQDHDRAVLVGTTSFGKGLVQTLFNLDGGYALKMTTAKWYTPSGRSIQKERKVVDGRFVADTAPDSLESAASRKNRPAYKSDAGRVVYGGGGITPDVIVKPDTISTAEQTLAKALAPKAQEVYTTLAEYALSLKPDITTASFTVQPSWREEFYRRLQSAGVKVDKKVYDAGATYVDRQLEFRLTRLAFGDSTLKRRTLKDDSQLTKAVELLQKGTTQHDLFTLAEREQPTPKPVASSVKGATAQKP